ncbi:MAG: hypothetical protein GTO30_18415 [Acidobacteria bacterium]|nr:hypothetical protein [Acidobacteriota bacterium]NIQ86206.1 hypothetical protein [Acidobacteriota bacterium]
MRNKDEDQEIVASVTLLEALRTLTGADSAADKTQQITQPIPILRVRGSLG